MLAIQWEKYYALFPKMTSSVFSGNICMIGKVLRVGLYKIVAGYDSSKCANEAPLVGKKS